jgi:hypothetical protein
MTSNRGASWQPVSVPRPDSARRVGELARPPLSNAERVAAGIVIVAMVGFGIYGFATSAPSTVAYLVIVVGAAAVVRQLRHTVLPAPLVIALAVDAAAHLAGGLVRVGDDVLYNASIGPSVAALHTHILQYDHFVHAFGTFLATLTIWTLLVPPSATTEHRRNLMVLSVLAGFGIGGINETIEFIATIAHSGAHTGGYTNTGWDLVSNTIGALSAGVVIGRFGHGMHAPEPSRA